MSNEINRLRELAGIKQEPVKSKSKKLDEGVIGGMQEVRHVSERQDIDWNDYFDNDREAGQEASLPDYEEEDPMDIFTKGARVDYEDDEVGDEHDSVEMVDRARFDDEHYNDSQPSTLDDYERKLRYRELTGESMNESREGVCMTKAGQGKSCTTQDVLADLKNGDSTALYFADETQIQQLIDKGQIDEDYFAQWLDAQEEMAHLRHEANQEFGGMQESDIDSLANDMEEDVLVNKEDRIVDDAREMMNRGMDLDSVVMALADEYGLGTEEQFGLYNAVMNPVEEATDDDVKPDYIDLDNDGDTEEPMAQAADDKRYVQKDNDEKVDEDYDNGYDKQIEVDVDGYFPNGAHHSVAKDAGPSSAKQGDNPLQKKMDVTESKSIHRDLASNYRLFKKS